METLYGTLGRVRGRLPSCSGSYGVAAAQLAQLSLPRPSPPGSPRERRRPWEKAGASPKEERRPRGLRRPFDLPIEPTRMAGARYWGDERSSEAVYAVYLRKLRYAGPPLPSGSASSSEESWRQTSDEAGTSEESDHLQWETVRERVIKAGTLPRLVDSLFLPDGSYDARQLHVFFATYRGFAEPFDVLRTLLSLYDAALSGQRQAAGQRDEWRHAVRDSVRFVLGFWLETWPEDFREPPRYPCLTELIELANLHSPHLRELIPKAGRAKARMGQTKNGLNGLGSLLDDSLGLDPDSNRPRLESLDFIVSPQRVKTPDVAKMEPRHVAEQLTYWDAELFRRLVPWQCCARWWGRRKRGRREADNVKTVTATVDLFNAVLHRLQTSILHPADMLPQRRARIVAKWITVAVELRSLKNFSSLRAVLSGLQSEPVHRLKATWALVPGEHVAEFEELARVFGTSYEDEETGQNARKVLEQEGTAKTVVDHFLATANGEHNSRSSSPQPASRLHRRAKSDMGAHERLANAAGTGTVPYLGSFLTDLTFIDEALPDLVKAEEADESATLINFEKRRKEFEVLAKLSLFQKTTTQYTIKPDPDFADWFRALPSLAEKDAYARSLEIEPPNPPQTNGNVHKHSHSAHSLTPDAPRKKGSSLSRLITGMWSDGSPPTNNEDSDSWFSVVPSPPANGHPPHPPHVANGNTMHRSRTEPHMIPFPFGPPPHGIQFTPPRGGLPRQAAMQSHNSHPGHQPLPPSLFPYERSEFNPAEVFPDQFRPASRGHSRLSSNGGHSTTSSNGRVETPISNGTPAGLTSRRSSSTSRTNTPPGAAANGPRRLSSSAAPEGREESSMILGVALHPALQVTQSAEATCLFKCMRLTNGERLNDVIAKALEKHLLEGQNPKDFCLAQFKDDGSEFVLPDGCNPFYAVVGGKDGQRVQLQLKRKGAVSKDQRDPALSKSTSSTLGFNLRKKKRGGNLFRWNSGFL